MTTHVFIVDDQTFKYHLEYLFAGTGAGQNDVDFNGSPTSSLYPGRSHATESKLVGMMADCSRLREGDFVLFYLCATNQHEGKFYGIFRVVGTPFLDRINNPQYLVSQLGKNLTFRVLIEPCQVFENGVTEWKALDEIRDIPCPYQMLWSLIYRKLKGNRGNTMITIYEAERLMDLIRRENNNIALPQSPSYTFIDGRIQNENAVNVYQGSKIPFNILPRLISIYHSGRAFEAHLQMFITQNIGTNLNLNQALGVQDADIEWIGNEVSCGVGMQRIDVMISKVENCVQRVVMPIELKAVHTQPDNLRQINRYIDWIEQYYIPNRISTIQPVLICLEGGLTPQMSTLFGAFNAASQGSYLPLRYVEYSITATGIRFWNQAY